MSALVQPFIPRLRAMQVNTGKAQKRVVPQRAASEPHIASTEHCIAKNITDSPRMDQAKMRL